MAQFRTDVEGFITREAVEACVNVGVRESPSERKHSYVAFVDPSGGSSDAMTLAIAHKEGETEILDVIRERKPPFSPEAVVEEFRSSLRPIAARGCMGIVRGEWPREQFQKRGVFYEPADRSKSEIYVDLLPLINSRAIDLLDHDRLLMQLTSLERRTSRAGKDSIDHAPGAHDDVANAVAGALVTAYHAPGDPNFNRRIVRADGDCVMTKSATRWQKGRPPKRAPFCRPRLDFLSLCTLPSWTSRSWPPPRSRIDPSCYTARSG